jgi:outer membrane murein-binding lipoprotein Lpp
VNATKPPTQMNRSTDRIDQWNSWLLIFLAGSSFILSYAAMYALAEEAGIFWLLVWLWPLTTEAGVVIFSLALLRARLHGYDSRRLYWLILICTGLSVAFNVSHAPADLVKRAVFALPPLFLLLAFKTLLWQVEQDSRRLGLVTALSDLAAERDKVTSEIHELQVKQESSREALTAELDTLAGQRDRLSSELAALREQVNQMAKQVKEGPKAEAVTRSKSKVDRLEGKSPERVRQLRGEGLTWLQIADQLGVSESTAKRLYNQVEPVNGKAR